MGIGESMLFHGEVPTICAPLGYNLVHDHHEDFSHLHIINHSYEMSWDVMSYKPTYPLVN